MKKSIKTIIALFLFIITVLSVGLFFGCASCSTGYIYDSEDFSLNVETKTIEIGGSFVLKVDNEKYRDAVLFTSEDNGIAIVSVKGVVTGVSVGQTKVKAKVGNKEKFCIVSVVSTEIENVEGYLILLDHNSLNICVGEETTLKATVYNGTEIVEDKSVQWESSDPDVLKIDIDENNKNSVKISAIKPSDNVLPYNATVTATVDNFQAKCDFVITDNIDIVLNCLIEGTTLKACRNLQLPLGAQGSISAQVYKDNEYIPDAEVEISCSDNEVAEYQNNVIKGNAIGNCTITAFYEGYKKNLYVEVYERILSTDYNRTISKADGNVEIRLSDLTIDGETTNLSAREVISVLKASDRSEISFEKDLINNIITLNIQDLPNGENEYYICAKTTKYVIKITSITRIINDVASFNAFISDINSNILDGYYILTEDIDYAGTAPTANNYNFMFAGVLDGKGHTVKNIVANSPLLWVLKGEIKNIAFVNVSFTAQYAGGICSELMGTIENCFVSGTINGTTAQGGICQAVRVKGVIRNCIVEVSIIGAGKSGVISYSNVGNISNVYGICAETQNRDASSNAEIAKVGMYTTRDEFIAAVNVLSVENGWNEYWKLEGSKLYFGGYNLFSSVIDKTSLGNVYDMYLESTEDYVWNLAKLTDRIGEISSLKIAGQEIVGFVQNGKNLTIPNDQINGIMGGGYKYTELVDKDDCVYKFYVTVITDVIENKAQFNALMKGINNETISDGYYILTEDIDFERTAPTANIYGKNFAGTIDGRGHVIENLKASSPLFWVLKGTVKDIAFINVNYTGQYAGGICSELTGTIENCFVSGTISGTQSQGGICQAVRAKGVIKNSIVDVSIIGTGSKGVITYSNTGYITNVYGICGEIQRRDASASADIANVGMFASREEFISSVTELSAESGWSKYWSIENGSLFFNGKDLFLSEEETNNEEIVYSSDDYDNAYDLANENAEEPEPVEPIEPIESDEVDDVYSSDDYDNLYDINEENTEEPEAIEPTEPNDDVDVYSSDDYDIPYEISAENNG